MTDPNQVSREKCKICQRSLPRGKTKFCSYYCARVLRRRKREARGQASPYYVEFASRVSCRIEVPDARRQSAEALVAAGKALGWRNRKGELVEIGIPLRQGEEPGIWTEARAVRKLKRKTTRSMPEGLRVKRNRRRARKRRRIRAEQRQ